MIWDKNHAEGRLADLETHFMICPVLARVSTQDPMLHYKAAVWRFEVQLLPGYRSDNGNKQ